MEVRLNDLPRSDDAFWNFANKKNVEKKDDKKCDHNFSHISGREIECNRCGAGFFLAEGFRVEDGKLYFKDQVVI